MLPPNRTEILIHYFYNKLSYPPFQMDSNFLNCLLFYFELLFYRKFNYDFLSLEFFKKNRIKPVYFHEGFTYHILSKLEYVNLEDGISYCDFEISNFIEKFTNYILHHRNYHWERILVEEYRKSFKITGEEYFSEKDYLTYPIPSVFNGFCKITRTSLTKENYITERLSDIDKRWYDKVFEVYQYLRQNEIKTVNVLFSGGADSSLVLGALIQIKNLYLSSLEINAITIEYTHNIDTFDIADVQYVLEQLDRDDFNWLHCKSDFNLPNYLEDTPQVRHQYGYAKRYLDLFGVCESNGGISVGTTNSDEFSFIGWFGKHSDMNVDIQFITDLHKFEINYILKEHYGLEIYDKPKGGLLSGEIDEQVFKCSYDDLSYYSYLRCNGFYYVENLTLENLHKKNSHKYLGQTFNPYFIVDKNYFLQYKESLNVE